MPNSIFISRELKEKSPFQKLKNEGYNIVAESLIDITPVDIEDYPVTDWIFFHSANGVKHFFNTQEHSTNYQYAVIGPGTATVFYNITGMSPKYTGNGIPKNVAENFITYEKGKSILFVKAKNSKNSVCNLLSDNMTCRDLVVYENIIKKEFDIPISSHLIFTSPINFKAYLSKYSYKEEKLYALGKSTAACIKRLTGQDAAIPEVTSEFGLYRLLIKELDLEK